LRGRASRRPQVRPSACRQSGLSAGPRSITADRSVGAYVTSRGTARSSLEARPGHVARRQQQRGQRECERDQRCGERERASGVLTDCDPVEEGDREPTAEEGGGPSAPAVVDDRPDPGDERREDPPGRLEERNEEDTGTDEVGRIRFDGRTGTDGVGDSRVAPVAVEPIDLSVGLDHHEAAVARNRIDFRGVGSKPDGIGSSPGRRETGRGRGWRAVSRRSGGLQTGGRRRSLRAGPRR
jgi:hypothetical protein